MKTKHYCGLDTVKLICAVLIVFIHIPPFESVSHTLNALTVNYICRIGVPFFFITSGFLLFKKSDGKLPPRSAVVKYIKRILKLYIIWSAIYFPFTILQMIRSESAVRVFLNWLKNMIFSAGYGVLWYLPATVAAVMVVCLLLKRGMNINGVIAVCMGLYIIGLLGQSYYGLIRPFVSDAPFWTAIKTLYHLIGTTRNGVFEGALFVAMGAKVAGEKSMPKCSTSVLGLLVSMGLLLGEVLLVSQKGWRLGYDMYLFLVPCAYFLLKVALCLPDMNGRICKLARNYSSLIYFSHMLAAEFLWMLPLSTPLASPEAFAVVLAATLLLDSAILFLSHRRCGHIFKNLY